MSPRFDEMEAGGVGAVHLADRRTAVQRNAYMRSARKKWCGRCAPFPLLARSGDLLDAHEDYALVALWFPNFNAIE